MRVLVTGNQGYIGTILTQRLRERRHDVIGYDTGYYRGCELEPTSLAAHVQISKDLRNVSAQDLAGTEAVIHLAALSNDPVGQLDPCLTEEINFSATLRLADLAQRAGARRFVYASSQSMYGISNTEEELDEDQSEKHPVTAYARTKWQAEQELKKLASDDFVVVCLRPSSVFGASPSFRADIVFNSLVASAYTTRRIEVRSDGTPYRPVVHVRDVATAFLAALEAPPELVGGQSFNLGISHGNFTIQQLAEAAQRAVPGSTIAYTGAQSASRTYRVSFSKILTTLNKYYQPQWDLDRGGKELVDFFQRVGFTEEHFRGRACNRVAQIRYLRDTQALNSNLEWHT